MDYHSVFAISAAGMSLEKTRLDVAALNLANMHTSRTADGKPWQPLRVVASAVPFGEQFDAGMAELPAASMQYSIQAMDLPPRLVHEPGHPDADANGYVSLPAVDHLGEMMQITSALRAYEANLVALNAAKAMAQKAMDIGGGA